MRVLKNWMLLGPFDLGLNKFPANTNEVPINFLNIQVPELNFEKTYQGKIGQINWQEYNSERDRIKLDEAFGNAEMAYGFGITFIKSPDSRKVFAQIGWGSNLGRIYVNGEEIPGAAIPGEHIYSWWAHFELHLQKGWNTLIILSADYNGWWDYRMEIAAPSNVLKFSIKPTTVEEK